MYNRDVPLMRAHALANPKGLTDVITFVLCTIQQSFSGVHNQMADIKAVGLESRFLFGAKRAGLAYAIEHADVLHAAIVKAVEVNDVVGAIDVLTNIPGLGMVKAAFVAQICGLDAACLDGHNLKRLGLPETAFKLPKTLKAETRRAKIAQYADLCKRHGGTEYWWNSWCEYVAGNRANKRLPTADAVSAYHVECVL